MSFKRCSRCNKEFECRAQDIGACWCVDYKLDRKTGDELKASFADCLCPECLALYETGNKDNGQAQPAVTTDNKDL